MKNAISGLAASALVGGLIGVGVALAPPASAGCQPGDPLESFCDFPVRPNGTWQRCHEAPGGPVMDGRVVGELPPIEECFLVDPSLPWPPANVGPHFHID
ncbi:CDGP domain-containing protein [Mycobacterium conspicuum]|uniref:CDGP domain-containing protein n=1 Tax=Mycobacterium conspicuum TaxID=44010 RepID=A0A7I7YHE4_9MYCO|nr:hypothetical protein [Mycobacterium conspicuum]BBZ41186.1 hypothetical protein MCNS_42490 [Mycobacterium conspicuum]